jgi:hypothetical protein
MQARELGATDRDAAVKAEIERLLSLAPGEVKVLWRMRFRKDVPRALATQLLVRMLTWKVQEEAFGGHDATTLKLLKAFAGQDADKVVLFRKLKAGTTVVREYQGILLQRAQCFAIRKFHRIGREIVWRGHQRQRQCDAFHAVFLRSISHAAGRSVRA